MFVCELLEISGGIHQILELLIEIIACDHPTEQGDEKEAFDVLCLPVVSFLQKYFSCLILSQQDSAVVFEGLYHHVLKHLHRPVELTTSQKAVFLFLHGLYTNCSYLQRTYRSLFSDHYRQFKEIPGVLNESYSPTKTESTWQRTWLLVHIANPSTCSITQVCAYIKNNSYAKATFIFVTDVFSSACRKNINCPTCLLYTSDAADE